MFSLLRSFFQGANPVALPLTEVEKAPEPAPVTQDPIDRLTKTVQQEFTEIAKTLGVTQDCLPNIMKDEFYTQLRDLVVNSMNKLKAANKTPDIAESETVTILKEKFMNFLKSVKSGEIKDPDVKFV